MEGLEQYPGKPQGNSLYDKNWMISTRMKVLIGATVLTIVILNTVLARIFIILSRSRPKPNAQRSKPPKYPTHLLIVLGSGGHTTEMFDMLRRLPLSPTLYHHRTYVVSAGDGFSALKAAEFEEQMLGWEGSATQPSYTIVTVTRARKIHQSLLTTPVSAARCFWESLKLLQNQHPDQKASKIRDYPDLILTNGPGTGVCVVLASILLRVFGFSGPNKKDKGLRPIETAEMRTIFIESWARVKTLSLSGKILLPVVDRFLVQWPGLQGSGDKAEYVGALVA